MRKDIKTALLVVCLVILFSVFVFIYIMFLVTNILNIGSASGWERWIFYVNLFFAYFVLKWAELCDDSIFVKRFCSVGCKCKLCRKSHFYCHFRVGVVLTNFRIIYDGYRMKFAWLIYVGDWSKPVYKVNHPLNFLNDWYANLCSLLILFV